MSNILFDYAIPFNQVESLPSPSTGFLHRLGIVLPMETAGSVTVINDGSDTNPVVIQFVGNHKLDSEVSLAWTSSASGVSALAKAKALSDITADEMATLLGEAIIGTPQDAPATYTVESGLLTVTADGGETFQTSGLTLTNVIYQTSSIVEVNDPTLLPSLTSYAAEVQGAFDGGLNRLTLLFVTDITELPAMILDKESEFYTLYCHQFFDLNLFEDNSTSWKGVRGSVDLEDPAEDFHKSGKNCLFLHEPLGLSSYNPLLAFGSLLSASQWRNQQYIPTSNEEGLVTTLGAAETAFDGRLSFWLQDEENGNRLGFFVAGGKSITTPYISRQLEQEMQFRMTNFLTVNQPFNVAVERAELARIGAKLITEYEDLGYLDPDATNIISVSAGQEVFVASAELTTSPAVALWRMRIQAYQTQG